LASVLYREKVYFSIKAVSPGLSQEKLKKNVRQAGLRYVLLSSVVTLMVSMASVGPLLMAGTDLTLEGAIRASSLMYATTILAFTFMLCASSSWITQEYGLFRPLTHLPLRRRDIRTLAFLTAASDALPLALVPLAYGILSALVLKSVLAAAVAVLYGYASMLLAMGASFTLSVLVARKRSGVSLRAKLARAFNTAVFVACMASFFLLGQLANLLVPLASRLGEEIGPLADFIWFIYPFSMGEGMLTALRPTLARPVWASVLVALAYLGLSLAAFGRGFSRYWSGIASPLFPRLEEAITVELKPPPEFTMRPSLGVLIKDLKMAYRDPRTGYMLVMPALVHLVMLIPAIRHGELPAFVVGLASSTPCLLLALASYQLLLAERDVFWLLFSSGLRRKELALGKALACSLAYAAYAIPLGLALSAFTGSPDYVAYMTSSVLLGLSSSAIYARYLAGKVGPETKMVSISVLDGLFMLAISAILIAPYGLAIALRSPLLALLTASAEATISLALVRR